jgi:transposase
VEHFLTPTLKEGQVVVVLDGLGAHRTQKEHRELIAKQEERSFSLFLPSYYYSPDL